MLAIGSPLGLHLVASVFLTTKFVSLATIPCFWQLLVFNNVLDNDLAFLVTFYFSTTLPGGIVFPMTSQCSIVFLARDLVFLVTLQFSRASHATNIVFLVTTHF